MQYRSKKHRLPIAAYRGEKSVAFTVCVEGQKRPFVSNNMVEPQIAILFEAAELHDCLNLAYCFMPDHLHVILRGKSSTSNCKLAMDAFKYKSGVWFAQTAPSFEWQGDYFDHIIRGPEDLHAQIRYAASNPVRADLVNDLLEYPFSGSGIGSLADVLLDLEFARKFG
jgi:putative transposase